MLEAGIDLRTRPETSKEKISSAGAAILQSIATPVSVGNRFFKSVSDQLDQLAPLLIVAGLNVVRADLQGVSLGVPIFGAQAEVWLVNKDSLVHGIQKLAIGCSSVLERGGKGRVFALSLDIFLPGVK